MGLDLDRSSIAGSWAGLVLSWRLTDSCKLNRMGDGVECIVCTLLVCTFIYHRGRYDLVDIHGMVGVLIPPCKLAEQVQSNHPTINIIPLSQKKTSTHFSLTTISSHLSSKDQHSEKRSFQNHPLS
jgi:hypothetical protein